MTLSKIALFAFGLAAVLVAGNVSADAATRMRGSWMDAYASTVSPGAATRGNEEIRFDRAKGGFN